MFLFYVDDRVNRAWVSKELSGIGCCLYIYIYNEVFNLKIDLVIKSDGKLMI